MNVYNLQRLLSAYSSIIESALLIRRVEEKLIKLFSDGFINGTIHTCIGQELIGPCFKNALDADDFIVSNHRGHGHYLSWTGNARGLIAEIMGRKTGICSGFGGSQHLFDRNFISNGIQGGMAPIGAGISLANQYCKSNNIVVVFIGDGTLGEGVLYETFNLCSIWNLPVLFVLENNKYAQSTSIEQTFNGNLQKRVEGFGLKYAATNTWELDLLSKSVIDAVNCVRNSNNPMLLEIETYRLMPHSKGDDNRLDSEIKEYANKDVLSHLIRSNLNEIRLMLARVDVVVEDAVRFAIDSPFLEIISSDDVVETATVYYEYKPTHSGIRINEQIYESLKEKFNVDSDYVILGEDIEYTTPWTPEPYGGAFKVTRDLSAIFKGRVRNTPISEAAIVGVSTGLALAGMKPIVEIMFGDFITLTFDQILNHATKFCEMYGKKVNVPLIVRTPMGGRRGYGPTHSQSLEKHFYGIPNLSVVALNTRIHPAEIYRSIYDNTHPTLVVENKVLYTRHVNANIMPGFIIEKSTDTFPVTRIRLNDDCPADVTVVCYGGLLEEVEKAVLMAFDNEEISCEIICPTLLSPLKLEPIIESVQKTGKLLVVEEGSNIASLGSEIASKILAKSIQLTKFKHIGNNSLIPCSAAAESHLLPNVGLIFTVLRDMKHD